MVKIYQGFTKPDTNFVGMANKPNKSKDKFGEIGEGDVSICLINTRWGQLYAPMSMMNKRIRIDVTELNTEKPPKE